MCTGYEAALHIQRTVQETGRKLVVYQSTRYREQSIAAKNIISSGVLGPIYQMKCTDYDYARRDDWQAFRALGGGMLFNYGPHYLDLALYLAQDRVKRFFCSVQNIATLGDAEDVVRLMIETEKGMILDVDINNASAIAESPITIWGKYGTAAVEKDENGDSFFHVKYYDPLALEKKEALKTLEMKDRRYPHETIPWKEERIALRYVDRGDFYGDCLAYFQGRGESPVPIEETVEVMRILEECRKFRR